MLETYDDIGLNDYPIFDENYRVPLNKKITDRYFFREIGLETPEMFRHFLARTMNEIMPLYNQFYTSQRLKIDPLLTMSIKSLSDQSSTAKTDVEANSESVATNGGKSRAVDSNTPQHMLADWGDYASGATDTISKSDSDATAQDTTASNSEGASNSKNETTGFSGNQSDMLTRYRATFLNIDLDVINELDARGLFMNLYNTGDSQFETDNLNGYSTANYPMGAWF